MSQVDDPNEPIGEDPSVYLDSLSLWERYIKLPIKYLGSDLKQEIDLEDVDGNQYRIDLAKIDKIIKGKKGKIIISIVGAATIVTTIYLIQRARTRIKPRL